MALLFPGQESGCNEPGQNIKRHHHMNACAALVIRGSCSEIGDRGRFRAGVGGVLLHRAFDGHNNNIGHQGATFLNFPLDYQPEGSFASVGDVDAIVRAYERDPIEATELFWEQLQPGKSKAQDWPDLLASDLVCRKVMSLDQWADCHGLHPASISRGFRRAYNITPKRFRLEQMASRAARCIRYSNDKFASIAEDVGFADQAHMTRTIIQLFGMSPLRFRTTG